MSKVQKVKKADMAEEAGHLSDRLRASRPDLESEFDTNTFKRDLALAMRALRRKSNLTQEEVGRSAGLPQSMIARLESPVGAPPRSETILKYVRACGGHMYLGFSLDRYDETHSAPGNTVASLAV